MKVTYVYSATVLIETPDVTILCDPWFTEGAYDGSWYHWPQVEDRIPAVDAIWISHVHPDHYDPVWLRQYLVSHPDVTLLVARHNPPILEAAMRRDGFDPTVIDTVHEGSTTITAVPHAGWDLDNIDSALVVTHGTQSVVNVNDCPIHELFARQLKAIAPSPTVALLPYAGAGPYPQTFLDVPKPLMAAAAQSRATSFLEQFVSWQEWLGPEYTIPFAGTYLLGGRNYRLNENRGIPDPLVCTILQGTAVLDAYGTLDLDTGTVDGLRTARVAPYAATMGWVAEQPMAWDAHEGVPTVEMIQAAAERAASQVSRPPATIQTETLRVQLAAESVGTLHVDDRYLHGLLTGVYAWDNALTGSNVRFSGPAMLVGRDFRDFYNRLKV